MKTLKTLTVLLLLSLGAVSTYAQSAAQQKPSIVFVHGLWADGSSWSSVIPKLQAKGYEVISVQNPNTSLADDVAETKRAIDRAKGPVILIGHSWGGFVITEAGNDPKVKGLVYVAAFAPETGETLPSLSAKVAPFDLSKYFVAANGFIVLSEQGIRERFTADLSPAQQALVYATQPSANEAVFKGQVNAAAWQQKPSWYIVATEDKAINPDLERLMAKRIKATTTEIKASHVVMLSKPAEVLKVIEAAATHQY